MKRICISFLMAFITVATFAQRRQIRNAEDAIEEGNYEKARKLLKSVESQIPDERESRQADFYLAKGNAYIGDNGKGQTVEDFETAGEAFKKAKSLGEEEKAMQGMQKLRMALVQSASKDQNNKDFASSTKKLYAGYKMNKNDTMALYYAANSALNSQEYDKALDYFKELDNLGYSGSRIVYTLKNENGETEEFDSEENRDRFLKSDQYSDPGQKKIKSKRPEITKMIALIYNQKGEVQKAKQAFQTARKDNPNDTQLKLVEAEVEKKMGNEEKYAEILKEVAQENPDDAQLQFRLGVSAMQSNETEKAMKYFKNAVEIDPQMRGAYVNMAVTQLKQEQAIVDKMNNLGMSDEDNKKYEKLKKERQQLFKNAIPPLKKAIEINPEESIEQIKQLRSLYLQLGQDEKAKALKDKYLK